MPRIARQGRNGFYRKSRSEWAGDIDWLDLIRGYWRAAKTAVQDDYTVIEMGYFNGDIWRLEPYELGASDNIHALGGWHSDVKNCWIAALFVSLGTIAYKYRLDDEEDEYARRILENMNEAHIVRNIDKTGGEKMSLGERYRLDCTCIETVTAWIDAYWRARLLGLVE